MSLGWVKLHRQLLQWEWYDDVNTSRLFIHCLLRANHSDNNWRGNNIKRGSFITSLESLSKETKLTVSQIRTSLSKLISTGELASKSQARNRVITVLEYNRWQANDSELDKLVARSSQDSSKIVATNKNVKNDNKVKNDKSSRFIPPSVEEVFNYCNERCNNVNAQNFVDHYKTNNWTRGKQQTPIKDWKACVRTWENKSKPNSKVKNHSDVTEQNINTIGEWLNK